MNENYIKDLISVCCLTYNHENFIRESIESIWGQCYRNIEILVLDDGSSDNSYMELKNLQKESPFPMTVIKQENSGNIPKNVNTIIKKSRGAYITFMSMDDVLNRDAFSEKMKLMKGDHNLVFVTNSLIDKIDNNSAILKTNIPIGKDNIILPKTANQLLDLEYELSFCPFNQATVFTRKLIDVIGGFDEDLTGDDIILRTKVAKYMIQNPELNFKILNCSGFRYRIHETNLHKNYLRQLNTYHGWMLRYFPDRQVSAALLAKIRYYIFISIKNNGLEDLQYILKLLNDLVKRDMVTSSASLLDFFSLHNMSSKRKYGVPFVLEFVKDENIFLSQKSKNLICLGMNIFSYEKILLQRRYKLFGIPICTG